jgi:hypothetical protein
MANPPDTGVIRPFLNPLLLKRRTGRRTAFLSTLCEEIEAIIASDPRNGPPQVSTTVVSGELRLRTIEYVEVRYPAWAPEGWRLDVSHQLVVIATRKDHAAICASQSNLLAKPETIKCASLIERAIVERAFVGQRASAMWLSGIHEKTDSKPMAKTLMGSALEYALDPLGDQSFLYSAMRSTVGLQLDGAKDASIGVSPANSRIWVSRPPNWNAFARRLEMVLEHLESPPAANDLFSLLANRVDHLGDVADAYEVGFVPPELFYEMFDGGGIEEIESWALETAFTVIATNAANVDVTVMRKGIDYGDVALRPSISEGRVTIEADWTVRRGGTADERSECIKHLTNGRWIKIRYASGHTISHGECFTTATRDQVFDWTFVDLSRYTVTKEKPTVPAGQTLASQIGSKVAGAVDQSLFGYVFDEMSGSGWLASDDGAMEIADFIHIADDDAVTLFHIKAAGSTAPDRQVSASKYEVVVGQAIKNLRHLDRIKLATALRRNQDNQIGDAVWLAGVRQPDRIGLISRAEQLRPGHPMKVVILQPQLTEAERDACNGGAAARDRQLRMKQLHTLMLGARLSAGAVGATLEAWAAK